MAEFHKTRVPALCAFSFLPHDCSTLQPTWFGFRPTVGTPQSVDLVQLTDHAVVTNVIGAVALKDQGEYAWPNAVRCLTGFCLFATSVQDDSSAVGNTSFVYRVSSVDASIEYRVACPGKARGLRLGTLPHA